MFPFIIGTPSEWLWPNCRLLHRQRLLTRCLPTESVHVAVCVCVPTAKGYHCRSDINDRSGTPDTNISPSCFGAAWISGWSMGIAVQVPVNVAAVVGYVHPRARFLGNMTPAPGA